MSLNEQEVKHLADLARLELTPAEVKNFTSQLGSVLDYVAKLQTVEGEIVVNNKTDGFSLRSDEVSDWSEVDKLISSAAKQEKNHIVVPEVFSDRE